MYNFNHDYIFISKFPNGATQYIECNIGQKLYYLDIFKNSNRTWIQLYRRTTKNRYDQSKYDASSELHSVHVKNDAMIGREFLEHIEEIENAERITEYWEDVLR